MTILDRTLKEGAWLAWRKRVGLIAVAIALMLLTGLMVPTQAQSLLPGIDTIAVVTALDGIATALRNVVGPALSAMSEILGEIQNAVSKLLDFLDNVVYPQAAIDRAKALAGTIQRVFQAIRGVMNQPVHSATLPNPRHLERIVLSKNPAEIATVTGAFRRVYQPIPAATQAPPEMRDLIDMTDAEAQAAMKRSIAIDQIAEQTMDAADQVSQELAVAAPGTAPMVEAVAVALLVRAHAHTQAAMAELMRVRAIALANDGAQLKINAAHADQARRTFSDVLRR